MKKAVFKFLDYLKNNKIEFLFVLFFFVLALILRITALKNLGALWLDELYSWYFASQETVLDAALSVLKHDIHMPLYFVILHFWIKLFNDNPDTLRYCTLFLTMPLIPLVFYIAKKLFNKTCAYFATIFVSINTFSIYYSTEVRFYGLVFVLSILLAYFFTRMLENFQKEDIIGFIVSSVLLFYTFSITPLLLLIYTVVGILYLSFKKKDKLKDFSFSVLIVFLFCIPAIYYTFINIFEMRNALTYYPIDNFNFNPYMIYDILENFFTSENIQIIARDYIIYQNMFDSLDDFSYVAYVFVPVVIALIGLIWALKSKNERFYLFFIPSMLFLIIMYILAYTSTAVLQTRYLAIIFPVVVCSFTFGFTQFKNKIVSFTFYTLFIWLFLISFLFKDDTVFNMHKAELESLSYAAEVETGIKDDDLLLIPMGAEKLLYYVKKGEFIPFRIDEASVLKDKESARFYFGDDVKKLKRDNVAQYLEKYYLDDIVLKSYEDNLNNTYLKNMKKGQRIVFISFYSALLRSPLEKELDVGKYYKLSLPEIIISKALRDSMLILKKHLKLLKVYESNEGYSIYLFVKE